MSREECWTKNLITTLTFLGISQTSMPDHKELIIDTPDTREEHYELKVCFSLAVLEKLGEVQEKSSDGEPENKK